MNTALRRHTKLVSYVGLRKIETAGNLEHEYHIFVQTTASTTYRGLVHAVKPYFRNVTAVPLTDDPCAIVTESSGSWAAHGVHKKSRAPDDNTLPDDYDPDVTPLNMTKAQLVKTNKIIFNMSREHERLRYENAHEAEELRMALRSVCNRFDIQHPLAPPEFVCPEPWEW